MTSDDMQKLDAAIAILQAYVLAQDSTMDARVVFGSVSIWEAPIQAVRLLLDVQSVLDDEYV